MTEFNKISKREIQELNNRIQKREARWSVVDNLTAIDFTNPPQDDAPRQQPLIEPSIDFSGRIFCLMGKSASGKDTVYSVIRESFDKLGLQQLVMYTTRPKRVGEVDGHEYNFIAQDELDALEEDGKIIERRDYDTVYGVWSYAIVNDEQLVSGRDYVIKEETPAGYAKLAQRLGSEHVFPIYIYVEDGVRLMRALSREIGQSVPKYDEMCRRYLSDCEDFADIDADTSIARFVNDDIEKCARDILTHIENQLTK